MANVVEIIIDGNNALAVKALNGVTTKVRQTEAATVSSTKVMGTAFAGLGTMITRMIGPLAALSAVTGLGMLVKDAINVQDEISKASQKIGFTTESLSTLKYAADLADVSFENLQTGLARLSKNMFDVNNGVGQTAKYGFDALGISVTNTNGKLKEGQQVLYDIADKFSKMKDGSEKTAVAITLLGRSGAELIPLLDSGSEGINKLQIEAKQLGLEISENAGRRAEEFNDNMRTMSYELKGVGISIANQLLPMLTSLSGSFVQLTKDENGVATAGAGLGLVFKVISSALLGVYEGVLVGGQALGTFGAMLAKFLQTGGDWNAMMAIFNAGFDKMKATSLAAGDAFKSLWGSGTEYTDIIKQMNAAAEIEAQQKAAKDLADQWDKTSQTLIEKVLILGMGPLMKAQYSLNKEVDDLKVKYDKVPGSLEKIDDYYDKMIAKLLRISTIDVTPKGLENLTKPQQFDMPPVDITPYKQMSDAQIAEATRVTNADLIGFALRQQATQDMFGNMAGAADNFYQASGQKSKEMFLVYKAFAIAQAGIATYDSAIKAYESMVGIPFVGPALATAAAAAAVAFGLGNIARIASMQPGGGVGGGISGNAPSIPSFSSISNSSTTNNSKGPVTINVTVNGATNDPRWVRDTLIPELNKAYGDGA